jgi:hypothetical protein
MLVAYRKPLGHKTTLSLFLIVIGSSECQNTTTRSTSNSHNALSHDARLSHKPLYRSQNQADDGLQPSASLLRAYSTYLGYWRSPGARAPALRAMAAEWGPGGSPGPNEPKHPSEPRRPNEQHRSQDKRRPNQSAPPSRTFNPSNPLASILPSFTSAPAPMKSSAIPSLFRPASRPPISRPGARNREPPHPRGCHSRRPTTHCFPILRHLNLTAGS